MSDRYPLLDYFAKEVEHAYDRNNRACGPEEARLIAKDLLGSTELDFPHPTSPLLSDRQIATANSTPAKETP